MHHQVIKGELTNITQNEHIKETKENSCKKSLKCGDKANCECTNVGINTDTLRKIELKDSKYLHTHKDIKNHNTLNKNERSLCVKEQGTDNKKYEEKTK